MAFAIAVVIHRFLIIKFIFPYIYLEKVSNDLLFNFQYHRVDLGQVKHSALTVGGDFYLMGPDATAPFLSAGLGLLTNKVDFGLIGAQRMETEAQAFSLYIGGGFDFQLSRAMTFGLQARYNFVFEAKETVGGTPRAMVQDTYSVLARWMYTFGTSKAW